jgi:predicted AAA+ superfamily ATPase
VGKTWLVRECARHHNRDLVEINFERDPEVRVCFASNDPRKILDELSLYLNRPIAAGNALLFLDEVQAYGDAMAKLRWFAEELPELPVIAAGSLLEFSLSDHNFSMPVGRVSFLNLEPMSFAEFLDAHAQSTLLQRLAAFRPGQEFSAVLHRQATDWFLRYAMVGGMPAVVGADIEGQEAQDVRNRQLDLLAAYRADFHKYSGRMEPRILDATLAAVARSIGRKFVYARVDDSVSAQQAKRALEMLCLARVCHAVHHTAANGLPLAAEAKGSFSKPVFNDVGLLHALLRTPARSAFPGWDSLAPQMRSQIAEQLAGQQLRLLGPSSGDGPELHYWQREGGRPGEIDYLVQLGDKIVPVELKSGTSGSMKSLHQFMYDKKLSLALRFDQNPPSVADLEVKTTQGNPVRYRLCSLPWYAAGFLDSMRDTVVAGPS